MGGASIILPIRPNSSTYINCVESIKNQTYNDWELIALLDRDKGNIRKYLSDALPQGKLKIFDVSMVEMDFSQILNLGIKNASCEYIVRIDDDDLMSAKRIESQINLLDENSNLGLITGWVQVVSENASELYWIKPPNDPIKLRDQLLFKNIFVHSSVTFRKSLFNKVGGYKVKVAGCEDYDLWLRLIKHTEFGSIESKIATHFINSTGLARKKIPETSKMQIRQEKKLVQVAFKVSKLRAFVQIHNWELRNSNLNIFSRIS